MNLSRQVFEFVIEVLEMEVWNSGRKKKRMRAVSRIQNQRVSEENLVSDFNSDDSVWIPGPSST